MEIEDKVSLEVTDREDSEGNTDYVNYDIFERSISSFESYWKYTETHTIRD